MGEAYIETRQTLACYSALLAIMPNNPRVLAVRAERDLVAVVSGQENPDVVARASPRH